MPLLGQVTIGGLTPKQAEEAIADLLRARKLVLEPQVSVFVEEYQSRMVTIQGAVAAPGAYRMLGQKTLLDMIGEAGGLNDRAGKKIFVQRPFGMSGPDRIEIDTEALVFEGNLLANVLLVALVMAIVAPMKVSFFGFLENAWRLDVWYFEWVVGLFFRG